MNSLENMRGILSGMGLYRLDGDSPVDQELEAYGAGLETVENQALRLEADLFARTAGEEALGRWERLYRRQASWGELELRREGVAAVLSRRGGPVLSGDLPGILAAAGIRGGAREEAGKLVIHVDEYQGVTEGEARRLLGRLLPLYLRWEIE